MYLCIYALFCSGLENELPCYVSGHFESGKPLGEESVECDGVAQRADPMNDLPITTSVYTKGGAHYASFV